MASTQQKIFVNYRRFDSRYIAGLIAEDLTRHFGPRAVFIDHNTLEVGRQWPAAIRRAIASSTLMLAVMGPKWLTASDEWGRRNIDLPGDWVRQEIELALQYNIPVVPVLVEGLTAVPPSDVLPASLGSLSECQHPAPIRPECWSTDLVSLVSKVRQLLHWPEPERTWPIPIQRDRPLLGELEIEQCLTKIEGWTIASKRDERGIAGQRVELFKRFEFRSFTSALDFMSAFARKISELPMEEQHHPLWRHDWKSVLVWYTTWDVGYRLTDLDFREAVAIDAFYGDFIAHRS